MKIDLVLLPSSLDTLLDNTEDDISILANASALINMHLEDINWVGFYLLRGDILYLGPFQGKPACLKIPVGKGVCGKAVLENKVIVVDNVHLFAGHIACDSASNSEIVIPITIENRIYGVLDIDSPKFNRFSEQDIQYLKSAVLIIAKHLKRIAFK